MKNSIKKLWNKYTRAALILIGGAIIGLWAFSATEEKIESSIETETIILAKESIPPYGEITEDMLYSKNVVLSEVPEDAIRSLEEINFGDAYATEYGFVKDAKLQKAYITSATDSNFGAVVSLDKNMRQIGVNVDLTTTSGDALKPGVLVDAMAFIQEAEIGRAQTINNPELQSLKVVKRLNAEGTVPDPEAGNSLIPSVVVLEVTEQQAALLIQYQESGKVYLLPSGVADVENP